jgi:hypothetical protein
MIPYRRIMLACRTIRFLPVGFWVSTPPRSITESLRRLQRGRAGRAEAFFKQRAQRADEYRAKLLQTKEA